MLKPQFGLRVLPGRLLLLSQMVLTGLVVSLIGIFALLFLNQTFLNRESSTWNYQERILSSFPQLKEQILSPEKLTFYTRNIEGQPTSGLKGQTTGSANQLEAFFPDNYRKPFAITANGREVLLQPSGANPANATMENGMVIYREAYPKTDSLHLVSEGQSKEFLLLHDRTAPTRFEYKLTIPAGMSAQLESGGLLITGENQEGLQVLPPWLVDAKGNKHAEESVIRWEMNAPAALQADGSQSLNLLLALYPANLAYPLAVDPSWSYYNGMESWHYFHTATKLQNGQVLVVGGAQASCGCPTNIAEVFNPATFKWTATRNKLPQDLYLQTATLLQNGEVLVAGGSNGSVATTSAIIYSPAGNNWRSTGSMNSPHSNGSTALLPDGRVLIHGGVNTTGNNVNTTEIYNPATGTWTITNSPVVVDERQASRLVTLKNGKVLYSGAIHTFIRGTGYYVGYGDPEIYDPQTQTWTTMAPSGLMGGEGFLLNDGRVIFATGEIFNPNTNTVVKIPTDNERAHPQGAYALMSDGRLILTGGSDNYNEKLTDIYDPNTARAYSAPNLTIGRGVHTATALNDGRVLLAGGINARNSFEIYNPSAVGNTNLSLAFSTSPGFVGIPVKLTAKVDFGGGVTGNITFKEGNTPLATVPVTDGSTATYTIPSLALGNHTFSAVYSGDSYSRGSTAPAQTISIIQPNVTMSLRANSPERYGNFGYVTTEFTTTDGGMVCEGTVNFKLAGSIVDTQAITCSQPTYYPLGPTGNGLTPGTYTYTAEYTGAYGRSPATSNSAQIVVPKIDTYLRWNDFVYMAPPTTYALGQSVRLTGQIYTSYPYSPGVVLPAYSGTVELRDNGALIGTVPISSNGSYSTELPNLSVGNHSITATLLGDNNYSGGGSVFPAGINVTKGESKVLINSLNNASLDGQSVTFVVQALPQYPAHTIPTGSVTLKDGGNSLGSVTLDSNGTGTLSHTFVLGTHPISAVYAGDGNFNASSPDSLDQQVVELCSGQVVKFGNDNGQADTCGTLSYAIKKASEQTANTVPFQIGFSTSVITLTTPLAVISNTHGVKINLNGGCQVSNGRGTPLVKIAKDTGAGATALTLDSNVTLEGFAVSGFADWSVDVQGDGNTLLCNWIGTSDGLAAGSSVGGIRLGGDNNTLGVEGQATSGNLIGGNSQAGLRVENLSSGNQAYYNWFGYKSNGTESLKNSAGNIVIQTGGQLKMGQGNRLKA